MSAAVVGVCLTVIGIMRIVINAQKVDSLADDFLAVDAVLFLASCFLSYRRMHRVENFADGIFLVALLVMAGICGFITFALTIS